MVNEVLELMAKLNAMDIPAHKRKKLPSSHVCLNNFLNHIRYLKAKHCTKEWSLEYIVSSCYSLKGWFKTNSQVNSYCRINLFIAVQEFEKLVKEMQGEKTEVSYSKLKQYKSTIRDYLFDLKPIAEHLERLKNQDYQFFTGSKYYGFRTEEIFHASCVLASMSSSKTLQLGHRPSQIAAVFVLRQALEEKFNRLINVYIHDATGLTPKIKHDYNYNFIKKHLSFFEFKAVNFLLLEHIYTWCNQIVHKAFQPLIWHVTYALDICEGLFASGDYDDGAWSIYGGVLIPNSDEMQSTYIEEFCEYYGHGYWCIEKIKPEAVFA